MSLMIRESEVQTAFEDLVRDHDNPGVDRLLISVAAPDRLGRIFPGEALVVESLPPRPVAGRHAAHPRRDAAQLHDWRRPGCDVDKQSGNRLREGFSVRSG